jgi:hypothetical protein
MYCWNCGTKLPENAGFCFACGKSQAEEGPESAGDAESGRVTTLPPFEHASTVRAASAPRIATPLSDWRSLPDGQLRSRSDVPNVIAGFLALGAAVLVIVGSFGPWVTVSVFMGTIEANGMDGDGKITLWCGIGAAVLLAVYLFSEAHPTWTAFLATVVLLIAGVIGAMDWTDINDRLAFADQEDLAIDVFARVGWGLQVMTIASFAGALLASIQGIVSLKR